MSEPKNATACVQCGLCLASCPTYELSGMEGYSPRGRLAAIAAAQSDPDARLLAGEYLDTCLGCRACEAACPSGVPYGQILEDARQTIGGGGPARGLQDTVLLWFMSRPWRLGLLTAWLWLPQKLGLLRVGVWLARHRLAPGAVAQLAGLPRLKLRNVLARLATNYAPAERERGQVVLFAGCVQDAWARDVHWATVSALTAAGYRVRVPRGQNCCGALHAHAGRREGAAGLARRNLEPLEHYEGRIVVDAAGCGAKLREYGELLADDDRARRVAERVRDVSEVLRPEDVRRLGARAPEGLRRVAFHDPCHAKFVQKIDRQPRALLEAAGYQIIELGDGGRCCGAAGSYAAQHPEWAEPLRDAKLEACRATEADVVAVGNPGCLMWMGAAPGAPRMLHPIQLIAMAIVNGRS